LRIVAQNVNGPVTVGTPAAELIELIRQFGNDSADVL
jgi:ribosomal protein S28E/S33